MEGTIQMGMSVCFRKAEEAKASQIDSNLEEPGKGQFEQRPSLYIFSS